MKNIDTLVNALLTIRIYTQEKDLSPEQCAKAIELCDDIVPLMKSVRQDILDNNKMTCEYIIANKIPNGRVKCTRVPDLIPDLIA